MHARDCKYRSSKLRNLGKNDQKNKERNGKKTDEVVNLEG